MLPQTNSGPFALERRPSAFLSLAPTTSDSYPTLPKSPTQVQESAAQVQQTESSPTDEAKKPVVPSAEEVAELLKNRRSSSSGSDGSSKRGFLRLGPVHFGEGDGDWSEDALSV